VGYGVYLGAPDPVSQRCVAGTLSGDWCSGSCSQTDTTHAYSNQPTFFTGGHNPGSCPPTDLCDAYPVDPCSNGYPENCFYRYTSS
jgi:hypothetical protein